MKIGFIGTGVMGIGMIRNLRQAGHSLTLYTRTKARAEALLAEGAFWADTIGEVCSGADAVITMVGYPEDVESVYFGEEGVLASAGQGTLLIDMTTSDPDLAVRIAEEGDERGLAVLDAPVSGGDKGAREGTLSIMVGGSREAFQSAERIFSAVGGNIVHQGPAGFGQRAKMANQIAIASTMMGVCEAIHFAEASGLDPFLVMDSIEHGAAGSWSLSNLMPRAMKEDYAPGFYVKHFLKDMKIALNSAEKTGIDLPGLALARSLYERLAEDGGAEDGTQALLRLFRQGRTGP